MLCAATLFPLAVLALGWLYWKLMDEAFSRTRTDTRASAASSSSAVSSGAAARRRW